MAARPRIGLRQIRSLGAAQTLWDSSLPGFGTRRQNGSAVAYILKYRTAEGRQRWFTIGRHGAPWTPETARAEAKRLLGDIARRMILRPIKGPAATHRPCPSCVKSISQMPKPARWGGDEGHQRRQARWQPTAAASNGILSRCSGGGRLPA